MKNKPKTDIVDILNETFIKGQLYKDVMSKKDLWKHLSDLYLGKFKIKQTLNKDINTFLLEIPYKNSKLIFTESDTRPLKVEIELKLNKTFEFNISWEDGIERILKFFGKQDIQIGDAEFDKKYLIQSNDQTLIKKILNYGDFKKKFVKLDIYLLSLDFDKKKDRYKMMTVKDRNADSKEIMIELIEMEFGLIDFLINENILTE